MDTDGAQPGLDRLAVLSGRSWRPAELTGGLTNRNLRVTSTDDGPPLDLVVRCSTSVTGLLGIDRDAEHENTRRAAESGVGAQVLEYRPELGMLAISYLPGRPLDNADLADPAVLRRAATACRRLHAGSPFVGEFDMFTRQADYRVTVRDHGFALPPTYDDHADAWNDVRRALAVGGRATAPCNNDLLAANFIDDGDRVWLIDYEYSGNNDAVLRARQHQRPSATSTAEQVESLVGGLLRRADRADLARVGCRRCAAVRLVALGVHPGRRPARSTSTSPPGGRSGSTRRSEPSPTDGFGELLEDAVRRDLSFPRAPASSSSAAA